VFGEYARKSKDSVFGPFLNMLNRPDTFTVNQVSELQVAVICTLCIFCMMFNCVRGQETEYCSLLELDPEYSQQAMVT